MQRGLWKITALHCKALAGMRLICSAYIGSVLGSKHT